MKEALQNGDPETQQRVVDMMNALNDMLDADARGEDTSAAVRASSWTNYGDFFPDNPQNLEELVDSLARRAAAAQRLMNSLSPEQQAELAGPDAAGDAGRRTRRRRCRGCPTSCAPAAPSSTGRAGSGCAATPRSASATRPPRSRSRPTSTSSSRCSAQDYPGASLEDVDPELLERALGRNAVDDLEALRRIERELQEQGYMQRSERRHHA